MNESIPTNTTSERQVQKHRYIHKKAHYVDIKTLFDFVILNHFNVPGVNTLKVLYFLANKLPFKGSIKDIGGCVWYSLEGIGEEIGIPKAKVGITIRKLIKENVIEEKRRGDVRYRGFSEEAIGVIKAYQESIRKAQESDTQTVYEPDTEANLAVYEPGNSPCTKQVLAVYESDTNHNIENNIENNIPNSREENLPQVDKSKNKSKITKTSLIGLFQTYYEYCSASQADAAITKCLRANYSPQVILEALEALEPPTPGKKPLPRHFKILEAHCERIQGEQES